MRRGVLLINLGTPESPSVRDVRKYLREFLTDRRVIDIPVILRFLLVRLIIVPFRGRHSASLYQKIWNKKSGSPLLHFSRWQQQLLKIKLGNDFQVELAMRYQYPSIKSALDRLKQGQVNSIKVIPLFPQYASATTGSVLAKVMNEISKWEAIPRLDFVNSFYNNNLFIQAFANNGLKHIPESYDHVLFSFHGLPERHLIKCDQAKSTCLQTTGCCEKLTSSNQNCYGAQCYQTALLIADELNISKEKYTVCFQSRLGNSPWIQPSTSDVIHKLAQSGTKRILVFCPSFVVDCLETLYEISVEYQNDFLASGGEHLQLVESLNGSPLFIEALQETILGLV